MRMVMGLGYGGRPSAEGCLKYFRDLNEAGGALLLRNAIIAMATAFERHVVRTLCQFPGASYVSCLSPSLSVVSTLLDFC